MYPLARRDDLVIEELTAETVVFDRLTNKAHYLNNVSSEVWKRCDGRTEVATIAEQVAAALGLPCTQEAVELAVEQLASRGLMVDAPQPATRAERLSRRETLQRLAVAMAIPLIVTVSATKAAAQLVSPINGDDGGDGGDDGAGGLDDGGDGAGGLDSGGDGSGGLDSGVDGTGGLDSGVDASDGGLDG